jgi:hypothetical protein
LSLLYNALGGVAKLARRVQRLNITANVVIGGELIQSEIIGVRSEQGIRLTYSVFKVADGSSIVYINGAGHERGLSVLDSIDTSNHLVTTSKVIFRSGY